MTRLTQSLQSRLCGLLRAGVYPLVAAEATGLSHDLFADWMARGTRPRAAEPYRSFAAAVIEAAAQARAKAEIVVLEKRPELWLKHGPGKETPDRPGWTTSTPSPKSDGRQGNPLLDAGVQGTLTALLEALAPYPEALAAVAAALDRTQSLSDPGASGSVKEFTAEGAEDAEESQRRQ